MVCEGGIMIPKKHFKNTQFDEQELLFFEKLEKFAGPLRFSAHEMVECIDRLTWKSKELSALKDAYQHLENLHVSDLKHGIEGVKKEFDMVDFIADAAQDHAMNNADFVMYFDKQNHFNAEVNT